jgi:hypothetical protein
MQPECNDSYASWPNHVARRHPRHEYVVLSVRITKDCLEVFTVVYTVVTHGKIMI